MKFQVTQILKTSKTTQTQETNEKKILQKITGQTLMDGKRSENIRCDGKKSPGVEQNKSGIHI